MKKLLSLTMLSLVLLASCASPAQKSKSSHEPETTTPQSSKPTSSELTTSSETTASTTRDTAVESERDELKLEVEQLRATHESLQSAHDELSQSYESFQASVEPLKDLTPEEIEAMLQKIEEEEAQKVADEKAAALEAEQVGYETGITFDQLARTPDDYTSKLVKFTGEIVQVIEGDEYSQYRFAIDGDYEQMIYLQIGKDLLAAQRVLEDDKLTIFGESYGLVTYESALGGEITIPFVVVDQYELATSETQEPQGAAITLGEAFTLGDFTMTVNSFSIKKDYRDQPQIILNYDWINNSEETTSPMMTFDVKGFQDGVELDNGSIVRDINSAPSTKDVKPGGTVTGIDNEIGVVDLSKPILLEFTESFSYDSDAIFTYEIADPSTLP